MQSKSYQIHRQQSKCQLLIDQKNLGNQVNKANIRKNRKKYQVNIYKANRQYYSHYLRNTPNQQHKAERINFPIQVQQKSFAY
ncbi:hypothetical protein TTHERM_00363240 (macronuclear) [Tetrahymena thermophila SB210]|uniref:Uncharacterized protein n=1 Tax=Tetrahymena thermophila (strain SB210) TaxID=312017 RepID=Q22PB9_TETTS|nr:hypothetical protein TTHERM_00363240 [Tetrahymena thermophila SB210]EAR87190.1 hypothetical protein TTHERM_00363240 [Tetrahymena thermophila SB210]|eukprot:XP_001007435.1 hypothetical protein TTHERM_00363240 [Tetrahymena thermophila SB210]